MQLTTSMMMAFDQKSSAKKNLFQCVSLKNIVLHGQENLLSLLRSGESTITAEKWRIYYHC